MNLLVIYLTCLICIVSTNCLMSTYMIYTQIDTIGVVSSSTLFEDIQVGKFDISFWTMNQKNSQK